MYHKYGFLFGCKGRKIFGFVLLCIVKPLAGLLLVTAKLELWEGEVGRLSHGKPTVEWFWMVVVVVLFYCIYIYISSFQFFF